MSFNSSLFPLFFLLVVAACFGLPARHRWKLLLAASYGFYMAWKPVYVVWLVAITLLDYWCALRMGRGKAGQPGRRKWLVLSITGNLATLFVFKYAGFVSDSVRVAASWLGVSWALPAWHVLLPLGISFHTLQTIGYSIDVYRGVRGAERNLGLFALYVSFFPQMVAGPIERSTRLLPQLHAEHDFRSDRVASGLRLMLWGFFKKLVIADRAGLFVNAVYGAPASHDGIATLAATLLYAFQIYCDFSGYSDIACGAARVLGYELTVNFERPYFARSIQEFWRRWHISLSTWFRDYVYVPLGGSRTQGTGWMANVAIVFLLSGLWHGANWTFIVWGALHGVYYVAGRSTEPWRARMRAAFGLVNSRAWDSLRSVITFGMVAVAWILFRARSLADAGQLVRNLVHPNWNAFMADLRQPHAVGLKGMAMNVVLIAILLGVEHLTRGQRIEQVWGARPLAVRWAAAYGLAMGILLFGVVAQNEFLYFQF